MIHAEMTFLDVTNDERRVNVGEQPIFETRFDKPGELFRDCVREYGRCTSRVYVDDKNGKAHPIGWTFLKRVPYEDDRKKTWLREVWVTMHAEPVRKDITKTVTYLEPSGAKHVQVQNYTTTEG
jgi:hypothetical protein